MTNVGKNSELLVITEGAIITALALALSFVPHTTGVSAIEFVYGLIPMAIYALRRGVKAGLITGFVWGILDIGSSIIWIQPWWFLESISRNRRISTSF